MYILFNTICSTINIFLIVGYMNIDCCILSKNLLYIKPGNGDSLFLTSRQLGTFTSNTEQNGKLRMREGGVVSVTPPPPPPGNRQITSINTKLVRLKAKIC